MASEISTNPATQCSDRSPPIYRSCTSCRKKVDIDLMDAAPMRLTTRALHTCRRTLAFPVWGVLAYALVELAEGVGLWVMKRWGEYVVIETSAFLPVAIYKRTEKFSALAGLTLLINFALVLWLVLNKHLFGVRRSHTVYQRERESASIMEITRSSTHP